MGMFLSIPNLEKKSERGVSASGNTHYGVSGMQGWRVAMEDSHLILPAGDNKVEIYGVFDGHGGSAVSTWIARHFRRIYLKEFNTLKEKYLKEKIEATDSGVLTMADTLRSTFMRIDREMQQIHYRSEIIDIYMKHAAKPSGNSFTIQEVQYIFSNNKQGQRLDPIIEKANIPFVYDPEQTEPQSALPLESKMDNSSVKPSFNPRRTFRLQSTNNLIKAAETIMNQPPPPSKGSERTVAVQNQQLLIKHNSNKIVLTGEDNQNEYASDCEDDDENPKMGTVLKDGGVQELSSDKDPGANPETCGATAVVSAVVWADAPYVVTANAGDSRAVLCRDGKAILLSRDHKPMIRSEYSRIYAAGGTVSEGRVDGTLNLSRSLGDLLFKRNLNIDAEEQKISALPDLSVVKVSPSDEFLVIACDGVWDCLSNQQVVDFVRCRLLHGIEPEKICEELFDFIVSDNPFNDEGLGSDNMTCLIVVLNDAEGDNDLNLDTPLKTTGNVLKNFDILNQGTVAVIEQDTVRPFTSLDFDTIEVSNFFDKVKQPDSKNNDPSKREC